LAGSTEFPHIRELSVKVDEKSASPMEGGTISRWAKST
jgi:hypothetical protein